MVAIAREPFPARISLTLALQVLIQTLMKARRLLPVFLVSALLGVTGCANKKTGSQYAGVDGDFVSGTPLPERQEGVSFLSGNVDKSQFAPVYFPFDSYSVEPSEEGKVDQIASFMQSSSNTIIIAGFTDERGTEEYNRALGEKRAQSVRQAIISRGGNGGRLQTVSFGEEMPADNGSGESAWSRNRRAEFGVVR